MRTERGVVAAFKNEGDVWLLSFDGRAVRVKDAKGLRYIASLLALPGREVHVLDLVQPDPNAARAMKALGADTALDHEARTRYKHRIADLESEIDEADSVADPARAERARVEKDAIMAELSAAYGIGGRARRSGAAPTERARKAVTERVRTTLRNIERAHPSLGAHLRRSIRTGAFCGYSPQEPVTWDLAGGRNETTIGDDSTIRVMIVDDHPLWRRTLRDVLEHLGTATIVAEATDGAGSIDEAVQLVPDVILMDIELPGMRGTEATAALFDHGCPSKIVVLSSRDDPEAVLEAVRSGASGYLLKTAEADEIVDAVRRAHAGEAVFPPRLASIVLDEIRQRPSTAAK